MPLTHVCMWSEHGWKRVTASEVTRLHPGGTVHARSRLIMCELCGQYVTFTDGQIRDRYFKHSAEELSKDCPERSFSTSAPMTFQAGAHDLPLRLLIRSASEFEFLLGLLPVQSSLLANRDNYKINITFSDSSEKGYIYSFSRINADQTTYLSVGHKPHDRYLISVVPTDNRFDSYWPGTVDGISLKGTLFDGVTGKKLPDDADTVINHEYYLLTTQIIYRKYPGIKVDQICRCTTYYPTWYVYRIVASVFEESTARFFLDYHCRLTENAVEITPLWPAYIETPYRICHCSDQITIFIRGDATPKVFPYTYLLSYPCEKGQVVVVNCKERQQLLSAGRTKVLKYTYLWKDALDYQVPLPQISVTDQDGKTIQPGDQTKLPVNKSIRAAAPFDGFILRTKNGSILERRTLSAERATEINDIKYGQCIEVYQGMDLVWSVRYALPENEAKDDQLIRRLMECRGESVEVPHSVGALAVRMSAYPKTKRWLYKHIRGGKMTQSAYKLLIHHFSGRTV